MSEMSQVIDLLARTDHDFEYTQRRLHRTKILLYVILGPLYALVLGFAVAMLIRLWQGGDPFQFWIPFVFSASFALHSVKLYVSLASDSRTPFFSPVAALRESIRTGDTTLAPIVTDNAPLIADPSPAATTRIGPLRRPMKWSNPFLVLALTLLVAAAIGVPPTLAYASIQAGVNLAIALLVPAAIFCLLAYRAIGPVRVRVDDEGLRWPRLLGGQHRLLWRDAQSLIQLGDVRLFLDDRKTTYIFYSPKRVFTWNITGSSRRQRERAASQSLTRAISQHTGLPLRDVSTEARKISFELPISLPPHKLSPQERTYRFRVLGVVLLPFIIIGLLAGSISFLQPVYFGYLYAHSHASTPLYADPLTHKDSDWPETDIVRFAGGGYIITHDLETHGFHPTLIPPPHHYNNALYEVTARASGDTNAGLAILSGDISQPMLTFCATPNGNWWLEYVTFGGETENLLFQHGNSSAIHRGSGTPNRLAVLVQGSDFTFYINGHYMTRYHDDHLAGGHVGLYLDPEPGVGTFTDFAIYPA